MPTLNSSSSVLCFKIYFKCNLSSYRLKKKKAARMSHIPNAADNIQVQKTPDSFKYCSFTWMKDCQWHICCHLKPSCKFCKCHPFSSIKKQNKTWRWPTDVSVISSGELRSDHITGDTCKYPVRSSRTATPALLTRGCIQTGQTAALANFL